MPVSYIICAAGAGTRTNEISKVIPKPLLRLQGKTLLERSLESLSIQDTDQVIILHSKNMAPEKMDLHITASVKLIEVDRLTRGQLETALLAAPFIPSQNSVCVFNADTYFTSSDLTPAMKAAEWDGLIPCIQAEGHSWSFCQVEKDDFSINKVLRVEEKKRISDWCSVGLYWFKSLPIFEDFSRKEINSIDKKSEIYVAPVFNLLVSAGLKVGMVKVQVFKPMGSVEQIEKFWGLSLLEMKEENS